MAACEVEVEHPRPVASVSVGVDADVVDVSPGVFVNYYDAAWSPGGYYVYRNDGGYHYLDRYHMGPNGERVFERSYRVPRNVVHREFNANEHQERERPR
jgi:hypothetical protein